MRLMDVFTYVAIGLTIIGQIAVGYSYLCGLTLWMIANVLYLIVAVVAEQGRTEIVRNVCMSAITLGLIAVNL